MSCDRLVKPLVGVVVRVLGVLTIIYAVLQLVPGGSIERFIFHLEESAYVRNGATGGIR
jgi:ABC-type microcin C transport system permease subunit YejB